MTIFGLDYVTGPPIDAMKAAGVAFVCRYLSEVNPQTQVKLLTPEEAKMLSAAGIAIVSNYEWYAERPLEGAAAGVADAQIAAKQHAACGGPDDRPIYFSVDVDVDGAHVADYFKGVASVIGLARTGAYGSFRVLYALFNAGLITWGWQTYAWSGGAWESRAQLQQYQDGVILSGHAVDYNRAMTSDFGQWKVGGIMSLPSNWHLSPDGQTLYCKSHIAGQPDVPIQFGFKDYVLPRLQSGAWLNEDVFLGPQGYKDQLEYSDPDLGDGDQIVSLFGRMLCYPHNPKGAVAHLKGQVVLEYTGIELLRWKSQFEKLYQLYQADEEKLKQQPSGDLVQRLSLISGLVQQAGPILQQIGTAAMVK